MICEVSGCTNQFNLVDRSEDEPLGMEVRRALRSGWWLDLSWVCDCAGVDMSDHFYGLLKGFYCPLHNRHTQDLFLIQCKL